MDLPYRANLNYLLRALLDERAEYAEWQIPDSLPEQQTMMRSLLNVRPPYPVGEDFIKAQDMELQRQAAEKGIVALSDIEPCRKDRRLRLWQGDITRLQVDAIVNAANSALLGCFVPMHRCIDNAIHSAAGVQLRLACNRLMQAQGHPEPTGRAKLRTAITCLPVMCCIRSAPSSVMTRRRPNKSRNWQTVTTPVLLWRMRTVCKASLSAVSLQESSDFLKSELPRLPSALCGRISI